MMEPLPLVTVVCLCHNQQAYVQAAIESVWAQTYKNIELIVVDDASRDGSKEKIREIIGTKNIRFIDIPENVGNCSAFNLAYQQSRGSYLIDLAADDLLLPKRVEEGINDFANAPAHAGVHFSDAFITDPNGRILHTHYPRSADGSLLKPVPDGDIYAELISRYFICPPTMMFRREVLDQLHGYDESLSYEDFDFWIRSSRNWHYLFNKAPLVKKRRVPKSLGERQFAIGSRHMKTTFLVCRKAFDLNQSKAEDAHLKSRIRYEIRQCVKTLNLGVAIEYLKLLGAVQRRLSSDSSMDR